MDIKIMPGKLEGKVTAPPSKSVAHRMIIGAALAQGKSVIENISPSMDIYATINAMEKLGAKIDLSGSRAEIEGIEKPLDEAEIDCCESGSTLRFIIPIAAALGTKAKFFGRGKLPQRPITPYLEEFPKHGVEFDYSGDMPFGISGKLTGGKFYLSGSISSQFITGVLFALALLKDGGEIVLTSPLESKPYVDITIDTLKNFGINVLETGSGYKVLPGQKYMPVCGRIEGDYSQAAFFYVANAIGSKVEITGLAQNSSQGDKKIVEICRSVVYNKNQGLKAFEIDCSDIPDLVPVLAVLASFCQGKSRLYNASRLRIKECDRLSAAAQCLNSIGGNVRELEDGLEIAGKEYLTGGEVSGFNDHRIVMAMAVAACGCKNPLTIKGAECVKKSFPNFWDVYRQIGGNIESFH